MWGLCISAGDYACNETFQTRVHVRTTGDEAEQMRVSVVRRRHLRFGPLRDAQDALPCLALIVVFVPSKPCSLLNDSISLIPKGRMG
jgi:hypothetical protein